MLRLAKAAVKFVLLVEVSSTSRERQIAVALVGAVVFDSSQHPQRLAEKVQRQSCLGYRDDSDISAAGASEGGPGAPSTVTSSVGVRENGFETTCSGGEGGGGGGGNPSSYEGVIIDTEVHFSEDAVLARLHSRLTVTRSVHRYLSLPQATTVVLHVDLPPGHIADCAAAASALWCTLAMDGPTGMVLWWRAQQPQQPQQQPQHQQQHQHQHQHPLQLQLATLPKNDLIERDLLPDDWAWVSAVLLRSVLFPFISKICFQIWLLITSNLLHG
jgi:hypothetical protein